MLRCTAKKSPSNCRLRDSARLRRNGRNTGKIARLDMSEYNLAGAASRLLMKADGEPSDLIQRLREKPFSVVLFDEIEKADAQAFDVLLGLFDEGRLTDRFGRVTNFTSTVVIMTSNLGAERPVSAKTKTFPAKKKSKPFSDRNFLIVWTRSSSSNRSIKRRFCKSPKKKSPQSRGAKVWRKKEFGLFGQKVIFFAA